MGGRADLAAYDWGSGEEELLRHYMRRYAGVWARRLPEVWPPETYELHYLADGDVSAARATPAMRRRRRRAAARSQREHV